MTPLERLPYTAAMPALSPRTIMGEPRTPGDCRRALELLRAARREFGRLPRAERLVIVAAALGEYADFTDQTPAYEEAWERAVRSEHIAANASDQRDRDKFPDLPFCSPAWKRPEPKAEVNPAVIRWLLTDPTALEQVHAFGVRIFAAHVPSLLNLEDAEVERTLGLIHCTLNGVLLSGARCRTISLQGSLVRKTEMPGSGPCAVNADRAQIKGGVFLSEGFRAEGEVRLLGARIVGQLACIGGSFINPGKHALNADGARIEGSVVLSGGFRAEGEVRLLGARIGGQLACAGGSFINPGKHALNADGAQIEGSAFLSGGFRAEGEVRLLGARIGGQLACAGGSFINPGKHALNADGAQIEGSAFLSGGFRAEGEVRLLGARIGGDLECTDGSFINPEEHALNAEGARVEGTLFLRGIAGTRGALNFTRTRIGYLNDGLASEKENGTPSWPEEILLTDCRYDAIYPGSPLRAKDRLAWLANHDRTYRRFFPNDPPDPQPYRQLAEVLKKQGRDEDARAVLFGFEKRRAYWYAERVLRDYPWLVRIGRAIARVLDRIAPLIRRVYRWTLGPIRRWLLPLLSITFPQIYRALVGFGYYRWRALAWLALFLIIGTFVFGHQSGRRMQPSQMLALRAFESAWAQNNAPVDPDADPLLRRYPKFNAFLYSADALIPLVSFHQEDYWTPRGDPAIQSVKSWWSSRGWWSGRWWTKMYLALHISMGWVIATLFAVSFTRLMRHD